MFKKEPIVLIVDDNENNLKFLGNLLKNFNYQLFFAKSGEDALQFVKGKKPDLILLDVMMPGMNGFEACSILKMDKDTKDIPIIFLTAKAQMEDILRGFEVGGSDYVTKPFNSKELLARINAHLELKLAREELNIFKKIVTICSHCKSVRKDEKKWVPLEFYISSKTEYEFSHGLCPDCLKKLYPEFADKILNTEDNNPT